MPTPSRGLTLAQLEEAAAALTGRGLTTNQLTTMVSCRQGDHRLRFTRHHTDGCDGHCTIQHPCPGMIPTTLIRYCERCPYTDQIGGL